MTGSVAVSDGRVHPTTFIVDSVRLPGESSWEIDAIMRGQANAGASTGEPGPTWRNRVGSVLNGFLRISMRNAPRHGCSPMYVLCGELVRQDMNPSGLVWDRKNGLEPPRRWYYVPFGPWRRGQCGMDWFAQGWLKPIPMCGQTVNQSEVLRVIETDEDDEGARCGSSHGRKDPERDAQGAFRE